MIPDSGRSSAFRFVHCAAHDDSMWHQVNRKWLWVSAVAFAVCLLLAFGDWSRWWGMLADGTDNGILTFLDRGDQISSILSGIASLTSLALAIVLARRGTTPSTARTGSIGSARQFVKDFVNRKDESDRLRRALTDKRTRIIVVHGASGVGKTELVNQVLAKLGDRCGWHLATPLYTPTVETILSELASSTSRDTSTPHDESPGGRVEALLRSHRTSRHVIVLDAVERLLNTDGQLTDLSLDEALELIATGSRHGVKVVLISTHMPQAALGGQWADSACPIVVEQLPLEHFRTFVTQNAAAGTDSLAFLDNDAFAEVHRFLGGRPRLAQLFNEIVASDAGATARSLAAELFMWAGANRNADYVGDRLRQRMTESFRSDQRRVYLAIAAFGTPVDAATVAALVDEKRPPDDQLGTDGARRELIRLSPNAIHSDHAQRTFFLSQAEARRALDWRAEPDPRKARADRRLLERAAEALRRRRQTDRHGDWADPQALLAEVDIWLRADLPDGAFRSIEELDRHAETGSPAMLFRGPRQLIAERIPPIDQPANYAVLGYLYHASGDYRRARESYRAALAGIPDDRPLWKAKVLVNVAGLEWSQGSPESAYIDFNTARTLAPHDSVVNAGALTGMARCRRRQGQFTEASRLLTAALRVAGSEPGRMIPIAVRLLRLHIDQDRLHDAESLIEQVRESAEHANDNALLAAHRDALADLRLAQDRLNEAMKAAREAVRLALPIHDPVTALQARSTISMLRLHRKEFPQAALEATLARRYSGTDSLIVIALQVVSYRRANRKPEALKAIQELLTQAEQRTTRYSGDFAAWLLLGLGRCAQALEDPAGSVNTAIAALAESRAPTDEEARRRPPEPAPTVTRQVLFLLRTLAANDHEGRRLQPAYDNLEEALHQQRARAARIGDN